MYSYCKNMASRFKDKFTSGFKRLYTSYALQKRELYQTSNFVQTPTSYPGAWRMRSWFRERFGPELMEKWDINNNVPVANFSGLCLVDPLAYNIADFAAMRIGYSFHPVWQESPVSWKYSATTNHLAFCRNYYIHVVGPLFVRVLRNENTLCMELLEDILDHGLDINSLCFAGGTVLHALLLHGDILTMKARLQLLWEKGIDFGAKNVAGLSALETVLVLLGQKRSRIIPPCSSEDPWDIDTLQEAERFLRDVTTALEEDTVSHAPSSPLNLSQLSAMHNHRLRRPRRQAYFRWPGRLLFELPE